MWLQGAPIEACGVLGLLGCPRFLRRATFPTSEVSYLVDSISSSKPANSWWHQFPCFSITGFYKPTVQVSLQVCCVAATDTCKQCCPSLPPAPPAIETPMTNLSPTGGCYYLLLSLRRTIITEHIHSQQGSSHKNYNFQIFLILKSEFPHSTIFRLSDNLGSATSGSSLNKLRVVQYFRMNNFKAFHNC